MKKFLSGLLITAREFVDTVDADDWNRFLDSLKLQNKEIAPDINSDNVDDDEQDEHDYED